nr:MAG TPA: hypothetical protein [Crassvirales sp.]
MLKHESSNTNISIWNTLWFKYIFRKLTKLLIIYR